MSVVTDIIVLTSLLSDDDERYINSIFTALKTQYGGSLVTECPEPAGVTDGLQVNTWMGVFNMFDIKQFLQLMSITPWRNAQDIQILIKEKNDDTFTIYMRDDATPQFLPVRYQY